MEGDLEGICPSCSLCVQVSSVRNQCVRWCHVNLLWCSRKKWTRWGTESYSRLRVFLAQYPLPETSPPPCEHELGYFLSSPWSLSGVERSRLWESDTPNTFPLLLCRGQPQGRAPTEAAAAEGPDSDAGCSRELCQGNRGESYSRLVLGLPLFRNYFVPGLSQMKGKRAMGQRGAEGQVQFLEGSEGDDGNSDCTRASPLPCLSGLLCATGPALSPAHQVVNTADSFFEHWPEHHAYQPGAP